VKKKKVPSAAESAVRKLNAFFNELKPKEQKFIASLVAAGLIRAARASSEYSWYEPTGATILGAIRPDLAPELINALGSSDPGQLAALPDAGQKLEHRRNKT
jgi:hypothetical protein